jgi:DNA/RNA-binding domain of Phe-tRNA-synthetase-like protein
MLGFRYDSAILERYPTIRGGVILARGLQNGPTPPALKDAFLAQQRDTLARLDGVPLSDVPSLAAWRRAFSAFGVKPTQYRSAAEALLRRLTKKGDIPNINLLVDLANLVSIRYALPVAVFDARGAGEAITVCFAEGDERFTDLGADDAVNPEPGEVIFVDEGGLVSARRWCWRQSDQSAASASTTEAIITVEAHHDGGEADVRAAVDDLLALLRGHAGTGALALQAAVLSPDAPEILQD